MQKWYELQLDNFSGPLDLLLHMIKDKKMNISEVNLTSISNQYIEYIDSFADIDLDIASEYLAMAAYLIELKTKALIPKEEIVLEDNYEEQRDELINRLLEYHKIKKVTEFFKNQQQEYLQTFSKERTVIKTPKINDEELPLSIANIDLNKFSNIFLRAIEKAKYNKSEAPLGTLSIKHISPEEIAKKLTDLFLSNPTKIWDLYELLQTTQASISNLVAIFITLLDLAKQQIVILSQSDEDISIEYINV